MTIVHMPLDPKPAHIQTICPECGKRWPLHTMDCKTSEEQFQ